MLKHSDSKYVEETFLVLIFSCRIGGFNQYYRVLHCLPPLHHISAQDRFNLFPRNAGDQHNDILNRIWHRRNFCIESVIWEKGSKVKDKRRVVSNVPRTRACCDRLISKPKEPW